LLIAGIAGDLAVLGLFKYANFFITTVDATTGAGLSPVDIALPLGISFFTFTQIAFLVDVFTGVAAEYDPVRYLLFVSYFPHLIAGPVLHHKQIMPQFAAPGACRFDPESFSVGLILFAIGLAKKVLLADSFSEYVGPAFHAADAGAGLPLVASWVAALAYTFQLYFDFSGYSDMAVGIARMMGVSLPINFASPYKARNIIDFWRRWHITLSVFLRDYLYFALGGNRKGRTRRYVNLMITMVLGGLWHGASWTFVAWGALHGAFLVVNHGWRALSPPRPHASPTTQKLCDAGATLLTFLCVAAAWVLFRATTFEGALNILEGMVGLNGVTADPSLVDAAAPGTRVFPLLALGAAIVWLLPSSNDVARSLRRYVADEVNLNPIAVGGFAMAVGALLYVSFVQLGNPTEFLYFQF
jgi:alginate O-acetyltransferase complex protein AlgI